MGTERFLRCIIKCSDDYYMVTIQTHDKAVKMAIDDMYGNFLIMEIDNGALYEDFEIVLRNGMQLISEPSEEVLNAIEGLLKKSEVIKCIEVTD